jgi:hypothetical protein
MSYSYTRSDSTTFSLTHAKKLASKVATDLKRIQRFYGEPSDDLIRRYEQELIALLKAGYLKVVTYGFRRNGKFVEPTVEYTAKELSGQSATNDNPGRISPRADTSNSSFGSYLEHNSAWFELSESKRNQFANDLPIGRTASDKPGVDGHFDSDRTYSAGGRALNRRSVRSQR